MIRHNKSVMSLLKVILGFSISIVILYEIDKLTTAIKNTFLFVRSRHHLFGIDLKDLLTWSNFIRELSLYYILIFIFMFFFIAAIRKIIDITFVHLKNFNHPFDFSLLKYLNAKEDKKVYLVTGEWGSGKTHIVTEFLEKYFKFSNRKVYYISCFGLDSREQVLREIKEQLELNDRSFINLIQYIPIVGPPIHSLFKQSYSLSNIKKNSIFIFDDFERISAIGLKSHYIDRNYYSNTDIKGFNDINKEFQKIQKSISRIQKNENERHYFENYQRYNVVTGLINELVETYDQKAIIICNVDILGYEFVDVVFRGKLDCITYTKTIDYQSINNLCEQILSNQVFSNTHIKNRVSIIVNLVLEDFETLINNYGEINLRNVKSIFQAYLETAEFVLIKSKVHISDEYLISLFYNIVTIKYLINERKIELLEYFKIGGLLGFYLDLYRKDNFMSALSDSKYFSSLKWTGIQISGYWLLNMTKPHNLNDLIEEYDNYFYSNIENSIMLDKTYDFLKEKFLLEHVFYLTMRQRDLTDEKLITEKAVNYLDSKRSDLKSLVSLDIEQSNTNEEISNIILSKISRISRGVVNQRVLYSVYNQIYTEFNIERVNNNTFIHDDYNQYVENFKNKNF